jgi:hypothetical protein
MFRLFSNIKFVSSINSTMSQHNKNTVSFSLTTPQKKDQKPDLSLSPFPNDTHSESENLSAITEDFGQLFVKGC